MLIAAGLCALSAPVAGAQTKWYTIESVNNVTQAYYDDEKGASVWYINVTVRNTQSATTYLMAWRDCGPFTAYDGTWAEYRCPQGPVGWENLWWRLAPNQSGTVSIPIYVRAASGSGTVNLKVTGSNTGATWDLLSPIDSRAITVTVSNWVPSVSAPPPPVSAFAPTVGPKGATSTLARASAASKTFAVTNTGTLQATYALTASCGAMAGCAPSKTSTTLAPGATDNVSVGFTTPSTANVSNVVSLRATYTNAMSQSIADSGFVTVTTESPVPVVTPKAAAATLVMPGSNAVRFFVKNEAPLSSYVFTPICDGWTSGCYVARTAVSGVQPNSYDVDVAFQVPNALGGPGSPAGGIRLAARLGTAADTGSFPLVLPYARPVVTPRSSTLTDPGGTSRSVGFTVTNTGNIDSPFYLSTACVTVTSCRLVETSTYLSPGASASFTVTYTAPLVGQVGTLRFIARSEAGEADTAQVTSVGADLIAPTVAFAGVPGEGVITNTGNQTMSISICDVDGSLSEPVIVANGVTLPSAFATGSSTQCRTTKQATVPFVAVAGVNTVTVSVSDGPHTTNAVRHFTYNEAYESRPIVTALTPSRLLRGGQQAADTFAVRNSRTADCDVCVERWMQRRRVCVVVFVGRCRAFADGERGGEPYHARRNDVRRGMAGRDVYGVERRRDHRERRLHDVETRSGGADDCISSADARQRRHARRLSGDRGGLV